MVRKTYHSIFIAMDCRFTRVSYISIHFLNIYKEIVCVCTMQEKKEGFCEVCKTSIGYVRLKQKEWVCRRCGAVTEFQPPEHHESKQDISSEKRSNK